MFDNNLFIEDADIKSSNYQETDWSEKDMPDLFGDNEDIDNDDIADESVELSEEELSDTLDIDDYNEEFEHIEEANESSLFIDLEPAMEADALTTGLNNLAKVDGTAEEENNPDGGDIGDTADTADKPMAPAPTDTNLAEQTDQQMQDDGQETSADTDLDAMGADMGAGDDPNATAGGDMGATTTPEDDGQDTLDDPLKNIETKRAYKDKFVYLYNIINDSLKTMESFTPEYRSKICNEYYAVRTNLTKLKTIIYDICINKISKMTVDEVLRKYTLANHIYDLSSRQLKEFFVAYEKEKSKEEKKIKTSVISQSEKKRKNKLHLK